MNDITTEEIKAIFNNPDISIAFAAIQSCGRGKEMVSVRAYNHITGRDENIICVVRYIPSEITDIINNHNKNT